jgi:hypothetical protein
MVISYKKEKTMTEELKKQLLEIVHENVDVPGLAAGVLKKALKPALDNLVKQSPSIIDDILVASIYPTLESLVLAEIEKQWEGLFANDGEVLGAPV